MLEGILYFVLGFLSAGLIALMVSPAIWNRAVVLTKKRIESSVPLTLNEIQADKDQLRAEFAMSTRRLEMSVEELREKAAVQIIEINRKRDELAQLAEESGHRVRSVGELETQGTELRSLLRQKEEALTRANYQHEEMQQKLETRALELDQTRTRLGTAQNEAESSRFELLARDNAMETLTDKLSAMNGGEGDVGGELQQAIKDLSRAKSEITVSKRKYKDLQERYARMQKQLSQSEQSLESRERVVSDMRSTSGEDEVNNTELTRELIDEKANSVDLAARLALANLQMEALLNDASNENVKAAMGTIKADKLRLEDQIEELDRDKAKMQDALNAYQREKAENWDTERRENSILRERINDLAAQVTSMTASIEGDQSPINEILAKAKRAKSTKGRGAKSNASSREVPHTLADRIRALQETARAVNK
ncbi:MAG: hypothetical protein JKX91_15680 [Rhizobiaceae bacterium]|nr:hypothetical protein [Rhizobiaceae bacterium]